MDAVACRAQTKNRADIPDLAGAQCTGAPCAGEAGKCCSGAAGCAGLCLAGAPGSSRRAAPGRRRPVSAGRRPCRAGQRPTGRSSAEAELFGGEIEQCQPLVFAGSGWQRQVTRLVPVACHAESGWPVQAVQPQHFQINCREIVRLPHREAGCHHRNPRWRRGSNAHLSIAPALCSFRVVRSGRRLPHIVQV